MLAPDAVYVAARRALLDVTDALGSHRDAVTLVGAQAIYLRTGDSELAAMAPYTTDADFSVEPRAVEPQPDLSTALTDAGLVASDQPGIWTKDGVEIDLMVPRSLAGKGRRGADLGAHGRRVARSARGLEASLEDRGRMAIPALDSADVRIREMWVAGEAALLVAKVHKIWDRHEDERRRRDKDAYDILRVLRSCDSKHLARRLGDLSASELAGETTREAIASLRELFASRDSLGAQMVARVVEGLADPDTEAMSAVILVQDLMAELG